MNSKIIAMPVFDLRNGSNCGDKHDSSHTKKYLKSFRIIHITPTGTVSSAEPSSMTLLCHPILYKLYFEYNNEDTTMRLDPHHYYGCGCSAASVWVLTLSTQNTVTRPRPDSQFQMKGSVQQCVVDL